MKVKNKSKAAMAAYNAVTVANNKAKAKARGYTNTQVMTPKVVKATSNVGEYTGTKYALKKKGALVTKTWSHT